ncbi:MAG: tyrosine-type recombinase/integrase [Ignavibacteriales bacterium]
MPSIKLTDKFVASVKAAGKRLELPDAQVPGLILRVTERGRKTWVVRYRTPDGRQPRFTLGPYPAVGVADARDAALRTIGEIKGGADPALERRKARHLGRTRPIKTFDDLVTSYLGACERGEWRPKGKAKRPRTLQDDRDVYRRYVKPELGHMRIDEITRPAVRKLLSDLRARGITAQTNRAHAFIRQVFAYAIGDFDEPLVAANPATGFRPLFAPKARERVLTDDELRELWKGLSRPATLKRERSDGRLVAIAVSQNITTVIQLATLLLQRKSEIAGMRLSELDLKSGVWTIPGERMKAGQTHTVPLPPKALELIKKAIAGRRSQTSDVIFQSTKDAQKPVRGDSVSTAMGRITAALGIENATVHDLRRTGATYMASERLRIPVFIVSQVLAHRSDTGGGAVVTLQHYARYEFMSEKRDALEDWEGLLMQIVTEGENVIPLAAAG